MSSCLMDEPDNTEICDASKQLCVENGDDPVDFVLDPKPRRRYRRNMTKKPSHGLRGIRPEFLAAAFDLARNTRGTSQGDIAREIGCDQQTVSRILRGETREGGWKGPIIRYLANELWQIASEKHASNLTKDLITLGLKPKDDDVMTGARDDQPGAGSLYTFDLYEPWLGRDDAAMTFPAKPTAKTLPPSFPHSPKSYAFRVSGDTMRPRYRHGEILYVDPGQPPTVGDDCVFLSADRSAFRMGMLADVSAASWQIIIRPETHLEERHNLLIAEWPICEVIIGSRRK